MSHLQELADSISASVAKVQEILKKQNLPEPSFDEDSTATVPVEATEAVDVILDATRELHDLLLDNMAMMHTHASHNNSLCQVIIGRYSLASKVPAGGKISYADLAKETPLDEQTLARIIRHAITMRIFREPEPGYVAHTKASKLLANPVYNDWLRTGTEEMWPASTKVPQALEKWPGSQELNETGFCIENNTTESIFAVLGSQPERGMRFGHAMMAYLTKPEHDPKWITDHFDWASLGKAKVVHLSGGPGQYAMALAKRHENLTVVVQDMAMMMGPNPEGNVPEELKGRVTFQPAELFAPQSEEAQVYYFRWSLRSWPDKFVVMALKAQLAQLKPGSRIIIQDIILPEPGKGPLHKERLARSNDLGVLASFNARDRAVADWKDLLHQADKGLNIKNVIEPVGSALGILEVVYEP